jgi:hypothetical protein
MRIPKLRGFKNRFRIEYEVVNLGRIAALVDAGIFEPGDAARRKKAASGKRRRSRSTRRSCAPPGLVSTLKKPLKILGNGDLTGPLRGRRRVQPQRDRQDRGAGGSVQVLEVPTEPLAALGLDTAAPAVAADHAESPTPRPRRPRPRRRRTEAEAPVKAAKAKARPRRRGQVRPRPRPPRQGPRTKAKAAKAKAKPAPAAKADKPVKPRPLPSRPTARGPGRAQARARQGFRDQQRRLTMIESLLNAFRAPDIRRRILFVAGILIVFRFLSHVPVPGANAASLQSLFSGNQLLGLLDLFSGGGLSRFSIVALGVNPYINASIIIQLMTGVIPRLQQLSREGEYGRNKINQYTRYLAVPLALLQSYGFLAVLHGSNQPVLTGGFGLDDVGTLTQMVALTTGSILLMWLGELITEKGIGNGISFIIFAGIVGRAPTALQAFLANPTSPRSSPSWSSA